MSFKLDKTVLTRQQILKIKNDLFVEGIESDYGPAETIEVYSETANSLYIPLNYSVKLKPTLVNTSWVNMNQFEFNTDFKNDDQKHVYNEALEQLKTGNSFLSLPTGTGKCLGKDTQILMYDGTIKLVQDIQVGDLLMGDDSTPRQVLSLARGKEMMYKIVPTKGDPYIVNESHILSLKITANNKIYPYNRNKVQLGYRIRFFNRDKFKIENKNFYFTTEGSKEKAYQKAVEYLQTENKTGDDDIIDISLMDYLHKYLKNNKRSFLCGYKVPVNFPEIRISSNLAMPNSPESDVELDPYMLGCWLGDGHSHTSYITNIDEEILNYFREKLPDINCYLHQTPAMITYNIKSNDKTYNHFKQTLVKYNLIKNKHIPYNYKCNSRKIRLAILAGLLDTDGYYTNNCYEIIQKSKVLAEDITFIARSLGFACYMKQCQKTCTNSKNGPKTGTYYRMYISGSFEDLPILVTRKKGNKRCQIKNHLVTGIKIEQLGIDDYYGFEIDGNRRFLLGDFTVTHNTYLGIRIAHSLKLKTAVLIHRKILADQWVESIQKFCSKAKVQVVGTSDPLDPNADYYIFNIAYVPKVWNSELKKWEPKKLGNAGYLKIGTLIVDEAHIACASEMCKALFHFQPMYSIALTATPKRADGLDKLLDLYFGEDKIIRISQTPFIVYRYPTKIKPVYTKNARGKKDWNSVVEYLVTSKKRNQMIVDITQKFKHKTIMIMSKRVDHCKIITEMLNEIGESVTMMKGTDKTYDKTARILVSTFSKLGVGFDDQRLDLLILTCSVKEVEQYAGRLRHTEGKERIIVDLVDDDCNCNSHWLTRRKWYLSRKGEIRNYSVNEVSENDVVNETNEVSEPEKPRKRFAPVLKK